jgi:hypothetical protein
LKAHGAANIGRGGDVAHAKKPALPAIGAALGVSGLCRGGVGYRHQRSGPWCNDLMGVVRGKGVASRLPNQSFNKASTVCKSRLACTSTAVSGAATKA